MLKRKRYFKLNKLSSIILSIICIFEQQNEPKLINKIKSTRRIV